MKARRILLVLAVLAVLIGSAPTAAGALTGAVTSAGVERSRSEGAARHEASKLTPLTVGLRSNLATPGSGRRISDGGAKLRALCPPHPWIVGSAAAVGLDGEAGARLLSALNTPCCVRGPPTAA